MNANQKLNSIARTADEALAPLLGQLTEIRGRIETSRAALANAVGVDARIYCVQHISDLEGELAALEARIAPLVRIAETVSA